MDRFYWIRHEEPNSYSVDTGAIDEPLPRVLQRLTRLDPDSPELLRLSAEVAAADRRADLFAVLNGFEVRRRDRWAAEAHAWVVAPGAVLCSTTPPGVAAHRRGYVEAALLLAMAARAQKTQLTFSHKRLNATAADIAPLLARYELNVAAGELPRGAFEAEFRLSAPAEHLEVWPVSPAQRTRKFFTVYSRVSMALQDALRRWLRYEWLADLTRFADHYTGRALVLYWLSMPRKATSVFQYGYDVMADETLDKLCGARTPRIVDEFREMARRIEAAGHHEIARWYGGAIRHIVGAVRHEERSLRRLLAVDSDLLDQLINFGVDAARTRDRQPVARDAEAPDTEVPDPIEVVAGFAHGLRSHLRRGPLPDWGHDLATLIMLEATNAMRRALRLRHGIQVELRLAVPGGQPVEFRTEALRDLEREKAGDVPASNENLEEADALPS